MTKIKVGQRFILNDDIQVKIDNIDEVLTLPKGTVTFVGADKELFYTLRGTGVHIDSGEWEVTDGYSVTGLAEWIYQHLAAQFEITELLEKLAYFEETSASEQIVAFKRCIGESLEKLGFRGSDGKTS